MDDNTTMFLIIVLGISSFVIPATCENWAAFERDREAIRAGLVQQVDPKTNEKIWVKPAQP